MNGDVGTEPVIALIAALRPNSGKLARRCTFSHSQLVDVESIHAVVEGNTVRACSAGRRQQYPAKYHT